MIKIATPNSVEAWLRLGHLNIEVLPAKLAHMRHLTPAILGIVANSRTHSSDAYIVVILWLASRLLK